MTRLDFACFAGSPPVSVFVSSTANINIDIMREMMMMMMINIAVRVIIIMPVDPPLLLILRPNFVISLCTLSAVSPALIKTLVACSSAHADEPLQLQRLVTISA
jgi:hypothetical protein